MNENKIIVFLDNAGRKIIGTYLGINTDGDYLIKNPAILFEVEGERGQLKSNIIPLFFPDYSEKSDPSTTWVYLRSQIVLSYDAELGSRFIEIYTNLFRAKPAADTTVSEGDDDNNNVVQLFDE